METSNVQTLIDSAYTKYVEMYTQKINNTQDFHLESKTRHSTNITLEDWNGVVFYITQLNSDVNTSHQYLKDVGTILNELLSKINTLDLNLATKLNINDEKVWYLRNSNFNNINNFVEACRGLHAPTGIPRIYLGKLNLNPIICLIDTGGNATIISSTGEITQLNSSGAVQAVRIERLTASYLQGNIDATSATLKVANLSSNDTSNKAANKGYVDNTLVTAETYTDTKTNALDTKLSNAMQKSSLVNVIGTVTGDSPGLMSPQLYTTLQNIYKLLYNGQSNYVDTFNEILQIFEQYPEGVNLLNALASKLDVSEYESHEAEYVEFKQQVENVIAENAVHIASDSTSTNITQMLQNRYDYSFSAENITNVSLSIPSNITQGYLCGFSVKIGGTVPNIAFVNGSTYPLLFTLNGMQRRARQLSFRPMQTLMGAVMFDGMNVCVYLKEMQQESLLT